jgi:hypothetical protein
MPTSRLNESIVVGSGHFIRVGLTAGLSEQANPSPDSAVVYRFSDRNKEGRPKAALLSSPNSDSDLPYWNALIPIDAGPHRTVLIIAR